MEKEKEKEKKKRVDLRIMLVERCTSLRKDLDLALAGQMGQAESEDDYGLRWAHLKSALDKFISRPGNFDSRKGLGLAELIHRAEPVDLPQDEAERIFKLKPTSVLTGSYSAAELAEYLAVAYENKAWSRKPAGGTDNPSPYRDSEADLICGELRVFFDGCATALRRLEADRTLARLRKKESKNELTPDPRSDPTIKRVLQREANLERLASLECCKFCFRLLPKRGGKHAVSLGKTCVVHDPYAAKTQYRLARERYITRRGELDKQKANKLIEVSANAAEDEFAPERLRRLMQIALLNVHHKPAFDDPLFELTLDIFSGDEKALIDNAKLEQLQALLKTEFPQTGRSAELANDIGQLIEKSAHTQGKLLGLIRWFVYDGHLPHHPTIIALYMIFFRDELRFADEHDDNYHEPIRAGRTVKIDREKLVAMAQGMLTEGQLKKSQVIKTLASEFNCSIVWVRKILRGHINWK